MFHGIQLVTDFKDGGNAESWYKKRRPDFRPAPFSDEVYTLSLQRSEGRRD
jgi:hypothetical protein